MEALLFSTGIVALAEIGDKTQLLTLLLASRFKRPGPIILGILIATLLNHAIAAALGAWIAREVGDQAMRWILGISFLAMAGWMLIPDKLEGDAGASRRLGGVLLTTTILFFAVEIGDKTQVATVLLAARYEPLWEVIAGTTVGMLLANVPVVLLGSRFADRLPLKAARYVAATVFAVLAGWVALRGFG